MYLGDRYSGHAPTSEEYSTAGRSIKVGLTACDIVSKWTWAATLLQSSNVAFQYGVSGPFWYASGATIQVLLFAVLAVEIKRKCPAIHTALEVVHARWGTGPQLVRVFCARARTALSARCPCARLTRAVVPLLPALRCSSSSCSSPTSS